MAQPELDQLLRIPHPQNNPPPQVGQSITYGFSQFRWSLLILHPVPIDYRLSILFPHGRARHIRPRYISAANKLFNSMQYPPCFSGRSCCIMRDSLGGTNGVGLGIVDEEIFFLWNRRELRADENIEVRKIWAAIRRFEPYPCQITMYLLGGQSRHHKCDGQLRLSIVKSGSRLSCSGSLSEIGMAGGGLYWVIQGSRLVDPCAIQRTDAALQRKVVESDRTKGLSEFWFATA